MKKYKFESDLFTSEILCTNCDNQNYCLFAIENREECRCELEKLLDTERQR